MLEHRAWPRHARATGEKCSSMLEHGRGMLERREECSSMIEDGRGMLHRWPRHDRVMAESCSSDGGKCSRHARAMAERWPTEKCWGALEQWPRHSSIDGREMLEAQSSDGREIPGRDGREIVEARSINGRVTA